MLEVTREKSTYIIDVGCHWPPFFFVLGADPEVTSFVVRMSVHNDHCVVQSSAGGALVKGEVVALEILTLPAAGPPAGPPSQHVLPAPHRHRSQK